MRLKIDELIMIVFLIGIIMVGFKVMHDINSIDFKTIIQQGMSK